MTTIYFILLVLILALVYMRYETTRLKVSRVYFTKKKNPLKVIHLSDLHMKFLNVDINKVVKVLESERPDLVILTGDYIDNPKHIPAFIEFLEDIRGDYEICLCFGNHDYNALNNDEVSIQEFRKLIESKGVSVPLNSSVCIEKGNRKYNIIGIEDLRSKRYDVEKALSSCNTKGCTNIAISHNPDIIFQIPVGSVDYLLCGHFHGGQIWAPFNLEFKLLRHEKLAKMGMTKGAHRFKNINLNINSGLGNVCFPLRLFSPPEISVLYLP
ncbi:metallophosphoesterase [Acetivibrio mesophilus]|uniref:Metallophosphoesterase n=1 Tax=Acetivibrio mesophilus TaxID=2487273 RepID=A0A4Q0I397_9FIRM|nr:metallophosphoesterase [Acetivibrio mesophilus]ODM25946.1 metallophosphoesterase [Clostridium sp. Bc-iso-3]RXE58217.1 metallophosphoesterase [Acetivibrio mesophilus]HHV29274.1 metallophosphoesterase [Clostridium sp.]